MSFELRHRKHIQDELTAIVRRQLRNRARALTTTKRLSEHTYGIVRHNLVAARDRSEARAQRNGVVTEAAEHLEKTRQSAKEWTPPSITSSGMITILAASYRRSRNAMKQAHRTGQAATLHRWRKELKTLWYQLRLAKPLITGVAPIIAELNRLERALGDDHNLVVLEATLRGCRDLRSMRAEIRQVARRATHMRQPLRRRAFTLGHRVHVQAPEAFARWLRAGYEKTRSQQTAA